MPKYRLLTTEELNTFEKEFVNYLVVNGITAPDWEQLKKEEKEKAEEIVSLFSDVIMEGVLRKIHFLEIRTGKYIQAIQCLEDKMLMVALTSENENVNFLEGDFMKQFEENTGAFKIHTGEKNYDEWREKEIFEMTLKGFEVSNGQWFKTLQLAAVS